MAAQLQETIVKETVSSFKDTFPKDAGMQKAAIAGESAAADPVKAHFTKAVAEVASTDISKVKGNPAGSIVERVAHVQQLREKAFQAAFMVSAEEAAEVKKLGKKAISGDTLDLTKLDQASLDRLE